MATRNTTNSASPGTFSGDAFLDEYSGHVDNLFDAVALPLTSIGGTANDVTAVVDPVLEAGLVAGMSFWFTPTSTNTGAMTMVIGSESSVAIVKNDLSAMLAGEVVSGSIYELYYNGTSLIVLNPTPVSGGGADLVYNVFTANGTLSKPVNFPDNGLVIIECWGGGGGGHSSGGGGGGGGYNQKILRGADMPSSATVSIGSGGPPSTAGGTTTVGSIIAAYGGGAGGSNQTSGGGGGQLAAGNNGTGTINGVGGQPGPSHNCGNGGGGDGIYGGGGGNFSSSGGDSLFGGAGGGDPGGQSVIGGAGGAIGVSGSVPGGGGGRAGGSGARGEVRVRWIG